MQKNTISNLIFFISLIIPNSLLSKFAYRRLLEAPEIHFIVRSDKKYEEYNKNKTYDYVIQKLINKIKENTSRNCENLLIKIQLIVTQELNQKLNKLIEKNPNYKVYPKQKTSILNSENYDGSFKEQIDSIILDDLKTYIKKVFSQEIFDSFDLIKITSIFLPIRKWYFNENTLKSFNQYLNLVFIFGNFVLLENQLDFFLSKKEMETDNEAKINKLFIERKRKFINKFLSRINSFSGPEIAKKNLNDLVEKNLMALNYSDLTTILQDEVEEKEK